MDANVALVKMNESKSEMPQAVPAGNLKNRIDNNLKLSIPKSDMNFNSSKLHPSTAPTISGRKNQFGDLPMMKNLMKNWDHDKMNDLMSAQDYFVTTPESMIGTSSPSLKSKLEFLSTAAKSLMFPLT